MAFNIAHWGTIQAGQSYPVAFTLDGGQNKGAQFAEGNPENPGGFLKSDQEAIFLDNNGKTTYQFQLTNVGAVPTSYGLDGGSLS